MHFSTWKTYLGAVGCVHMILKHRIMRIWIQDSSQGQTRARGVNPGCRDPDLSSSGFNPGIQNS